LGIPGQVEGSERTRLTDIRARFEIYMAMPMPKIETMRPVDATVAEIVAALALQKARPRADQDALHLPGADAPVRHVA
jgi:hypothetical protein